MRLTAFLSLGVALLLVLLDGLLATASRNAGAYPAPALLGNTVSRVGVNSASATPTCPMPSGYRILIVYSDSAPPSTLAAALAAQPGVSGVDLFDAHVATPTLAELQQAQAVVAYNSVNFDDLEPIALGNTVADYQDGGASSWPATGASSLSGPAAFGAVG